MDLTGNKFSRLTLVERIVKNRYSFYKCVCDCGNEKIISYNNLRSGHTKSCGCLLIEVDRTYNTFKHGQSHNKRTKEYTAWCSMKQRCYNPNYHNFHHYGGRGIKIYDEWLNNFEVFFNYIGKAPSKDHSLDRINNDGNYEPGNVRWATDFEQRHNRRE